jgi:hypothetical protein
MYTEFSLIYGIPVFEGDKLSEDIMEILSEGHGTDFKSPYNGGGHSCVGWVTSKYSITVGPGLPETPWMPELGVTDTMEAELQAKLRRLDEIEHWDTSEPMKIGEALENLRKPGWYWVASDS